MVLSRNAIAAYIIHKSQQTLSTSTVLENDNSVLRSRMVATTMNVYKYRVRSRSELT